MALDQDLVFKIHASANSLNQHASKKIMELTCSAKYFIVYCRFALEFASYRYSYNLNAISMVVQHKKNKKGEEEEEDNDKDK